MLAAGGRVRVVLRGPSVQEAVLLAGLLQRSHSGETEVRGGRMEHPVRVDELRLEGCHDAGTRASTSVCIVFSAPRKATPR